MGDKPAPQVLIPREVPAVDLAHLQDAVVYHVLKESRVKCALVVPYAARRIAQKRGDVLDLSPSKARAKAVGNDAGNAGSQPP